MFNPINLTNGTTVSIPLIENDRYTVNNQPLWGSAKFYYHRGDRVGTVISLLSYSTQCDIKGSIGTGQALNDMCTAMCNNKHDADYYASGTGKVYIDRILAHIVWIIGSFETGGVGLVKTDNNRYSFLAFGGIYSDENETQFVYMWQTATTSNYLGLSESELASCMFYNDEYINDGYTLSLFYDHDNLLFKKTSYEYVNSVAQAAYVYRTEYVDLAGATSNAQYEESWIGGDYLPSVAWIPSDADGVEYPTPWNGYIPIGRNDINPLGLTVRSGSIYGDSEVDDSSPYANAGNAATAGGGGGWNNNCDSSPISPDDQFTIDAVNSGFVTLYNPTEAEIRSFNDFLFSDITDSMSATLKKLISDPLEYIVFIAMTHFKPTVAPNIPIKFCGLDSGVSAPQIKRQVQKLDCGYIEISEQKNMTKSFLSYEPYMKASVFLPYIGTVQINCDDIMGESKLHLVYQIDLLTGSCVAQLEVTRESRSYADSYVPNVVIGEYPGNIYQNLPITATDWRGLFASVINLGAGVATLATGNAAGLGAMASAVIGEKMHANRSGNMGANYGYLGRQKPCLILERPVLHMSDNFQEWEGYPSNLTQSLGELTGYTEIDSSTLWINNDFDGITEDEAELLRSICETGIIL